MDRIVEEPLLGRALLGHVEERADAAQHLAIAAEHRAGAEVEPAVMTVFRPQAEILGDAAAAELDRGIERGLEAVAVAGMEDLQPVARRPLERSAAKAEEILRFRAGVDAVAQHVPVPDDVAGAGQRQGASLGLADRRPARPRRRQRHAA